jgi:hypothetical protein
MMTNHRYGSKEAYEKARAMKNGQTCITCGHSALNPEDMNTVFCRRYPPHEFLCPAPGGRLGFMVRFPTPGKNWLCGEYKPRILIDHDIGNAVEN